MKKQQQQLEQRNLELTQSRQELDTRAQQLEQASLYKSEFLANMSHELRTPLNSIILLSKMMTNNDDHRLEAEEVKRAGVIHRSGQDLLRLINDVLDLSKVEAGHMQVHLTRVASATLIDELRDLFQEPARSKGLELVFDDRLQGEFITDPDKLSQIVRNLLSNAIKFTKAGRITLRLERLVGPPSRLRFSVRDTGIGIQAEKRSQVFEAFQQADGSTSREYGGTGLGLTISQRFARLLGGGIDLISEPGKGSEFSLHLPVHDDLPKIEVPQGVAALPPSNPPLPPYQPPPDDAGETDNAGDDRAHLDGSQHVILVIDDDALVGQQVLRLNRQLGYKTLLATSGMAGLEMARRYYPNGILLDLGLPDIDGSRVLHELKINPELAHIPVYIISARDRDESLMCRGAAGFLQKPVNLDLLAHAFENIKLFLKRVPQIQSLAAVKRAHHNLDSKRLKGRAILVVDDDPRNLFVITAALEQNGAQVSTAINGRRALDFLYQNRVDLVLMDIMMPEMDGYEAIALLRADPALAHLPVVALTAKALPSDRAKIMAAGADDFVSKPVDYDILISKVESWSRGRNG